MISFTFTSVCQFSSICDNYNISPAYCFQRLPEISKGKQPPVSKRVCAVYKKDVLIPEKTPVLEPVVEDKKEICSRFLVSGSEFPDCKHACFVPVTALYYKDTIQFVSHKNSFVACLMRVHQASAAITHKTRAFDLTLVSPREYAWPVTSRLRFDCKRYGCRCLSGSAKGYVSDAEYLAGQSFPVICSIPPVDRITCIIKKFRQSHAAFS